MSKWAEVKVLTTTTYAVEIEDGETIGDAINYAIDECGVGSSSAIEQDCRLAATDEEADSIKRHCDEKLAL